MNYENNPAQTGDSEPSRPAKKRWRFWFFVFLLIIVPAGVIVGAISIKTGYTFEKIFIDLKNVSNTLPIPQKAPPRKDPNRDNVLILGIRGENDPNGGLLSDVNMIVSIKKDTGQMAIISIPRDLYVEMPGLGRSERINFAYALGYEKEGVAGGIYYSKQILQDILYLYIDDVIVVNFDAFKEIVDALSGIDIYLDKPFKEEKQFVDEMIIDLPEGENHLDGILALYYIRSRFSTSDFDRMRRQQHILSAIFEKATSLGVLSNPKKIVDIADALGRNIKTTMDSSTIADTIKTIKLIKTNSILTKTLNTAEGGLLYSVNNGAYHLLPVDDNYDMIQEMANNIFNQ